MSRWICIDDICIPSDENDWEELVAFADAIAEQEPIDIVRCRECKWFDSGKNDSEVWSMCTRLSRKCFYVNDDSFCSYGEREGE